MKKVNYFDARLVNGDDKSIQFTIVVPTDDPGPQHLPRVVELLLSGKCYFSGGECDSDYFDQADGEVGDQE